jgi:diguanylate cyclase (GGDEF)-like protein
VSFSLPLKSPDKPRATPILVVEDNEGDARLVRELLRDAAAHEFGVTHVNLLADARRLLPEARAACVLLDLRLPDAESLEGLRELRRLSSQTPIVILSGMEDEQLAVRAVQEGAQDYLIKGRVDGALLARSIRYAIERKRVEATLEHRAFHDPLTGLANRALFMDHLNHALARLDRTESSIAVLLLDLDDFKPINDMFGHAAGDNVLAELALRLETNMRPSDTVSRFGGDEFTILLEDIVDETVTLGVVERIQEALFQPFLIFGHEVVISSSIGIASTPSSDTAPEALLRDADRAMYEAKRELYPRSVPTTRR